MKQTKVYSRRRTALRRILIAAAAYLLITRSLTVGVFLPGQTLRYTEEREGTGWTSIVTRKWEPELHKTHMLYLSENEKVTMLSSTYLTIYGWMPDVGLALDCSQDSPLFAGWWGMSRNGQPVRYYFGRVDDPEISRLRIRLEYETWENETAQRHEGASFALPDSAWTEKDGRRYFLMREPEIEWPEEIRKFPVAAAYDAFGNIIAEFDMENYSFTSYG